MVTNGALNALPMTVRRSSEIPAVVNHRMAVRTNLESPRRLLKKLDIRDGDGIAMHSWVGRRRNLRLS